MITFYEFMEGDLVGGQNMKLVGGAKDTAKEIALDTVAGLAGPFGGVAKAIAQFAWNNRHNVKNKINDDITLNNIKQKISTGLLAKKFQESGRSIDELVSAFVGVSDESQSYLSQQEIEQIRKKILEAANDGSLDYGYAQKLTNEVLVEKINQIQNVIKTSSPKSWDKMMRSLNPRRTGS